MHEATIAKGILDAVLADVAAGEAREGRRITRIHVVAGALAGIVGESLDLFWNELCRKTAADGSVLCLKILPAILACRSCGNRKEHRPGMTVELACASCGGPNRLEGGRELYVESMEVEDADSGQKSGSGSQ
ncbi:MAG TPA: hydrogenase maturation nickel metallochaperone HypA [Candidatus Ozemobacteraceae bacterium]|nr:hydrogenase maturation nickel metallochaperone HypA [Candidatus Ozemobacteraceae bacterium]